jgi:hypothetical protein
VGRPAYASLDVGDVDGDHLPDLVVGAFSTGAAMDSIVDVWRHVRKAR